MNNEAILKEGFLAAMNWLYLDSIEYVRKPNKPLEENMDISFRADVCKMRQAYQLIKRQAP